MARPRYVMFFYGFSYCQFIFQASQRAYNMILVYSENFPFIVRNIGYSKVCRPFALHLTLTLAPSAELIKYANLMFMHHSANRTVGRWRLRGYPNLWIGCEVDYYLRSRSAFILTTISYNRRNIRQITYLPSLPFELIIPRS